MDKISKRISVSEKLTVFFEEPFWVGIFERVSDGNLCRRNKESGMIMHKRIRMKFFELIIATASSENACIYTFAKKNNFKIIHTFGA